MKGRGAAWSRGGPPRPGLVTEKHPCSPALAPSAQAPPRAGRPAPASQAPVLGFSGLIPWVLLTLAQVACIPPTQPPGL